MSMSILHIPVKPVQYVERKIMQKIETTNVNAGFIPIEICWEQSIFATQLSMLEIVINNTIRHTA